jgi:hypothetical protein
LALDHKQFPARHLCETTSTTRDSGPANSVLTRSSCGTSGKTLVARIAGHALVRARPVETLAMFEKGAADSVAAETAAKLLEGDA